MFEGTISNDAGHLYMYVWSSFKGYRVKEGESKIHENQIYKTL